MRPLEQIARPEAISCQHPSGIKTAARIKPVDPDQPAPAGNGAECDPALTTLDSALSYRFDIVLGGSDATPLADVSKHDWMV
jgi:hypothetical protein